jgi:hypothetical protein
MLTKALSGITMLVALSVGACTQSDPQMVRLLLPEGDAAAGKQAFMDLGCTTCHTVRGAEALPPPKVETSFELGPTLSGLSRGGIATQVVAPRHVNVEATDLWTDWEPGQRVWLGPGQDVEENKEAELRRTSRMIDYGAVMTVKQLSDLVAFLQSAAEAD